MIIKIRIFLDHARAKNLGIRNSLAITPLDDESNRHRSACYKAANWIQVGKTAGRGKKCPTHKSILSI